MQAILYRPQCIKFKGAHFDSLTQDCGDYIANAVELPQSYAKPSIKS